MADTTRIQGLASKKINLKPNPAIDSVNIYGHIEM